MDISVADTDQSLHARQTNWDFAQTLAYTRQTQIECLKRDFLNEHFERSNDLVVSTVCAL